jgi:DNA repair photolyase
MVTTSFVLVTSGAIMEPPAPLRGRGATDNPANRFELITIERDPTTPDDEVPSPRTCFYRDTSRSIIAYNDSPDIPFDAAVNPYRGCEHGCSYCYARPFHEYLGFSAGLDFETRILVKEDAPTLLRRELSSPRWTPQVVTISGVTDPYQPIERRLQLTRRCLEVFAEFRNPVGIVTKSHLVARDRDLLADLARDRAALVFLSVTTLDADLAGRMEPRASSPVGRLAALAELSAAGVPVGVMVAPVIPGLNDHEIPAILDAAFQAGARQAGFVLLRLPHGVADLFDTWLQQHYPARRDKVLGRLREMHGGELYDARFGHRQRGEGPMAKQIKALFDLACRRTGLNARKYELSTAAFRRPGGTQRLLFE